jgi:hypothetical protein
MARESGAEFEVDAHYEIDSAYCDSTASIETAPAESWSEVTCEEDDRIYHKYGSNFSRILRSQLTVYKVVRLCPRRRPWDGSTRLLVSGPLLLNLSCLLTSL